MIEVENSVTFPTSEAYNRFADLDDMGKIAAIDLRKNHPVTMKQAATLVGKTDGDQELIDQIPDLFEDGYSVENVKLWINAQKDLQEDQ